MNRREFLKKAGISFGIAAAAGNAVLQTACSESPEARKKKEEREAQAEKQRREEAERKAVQGRFLKDYRFYASFLEQAKNADVANEFRLDVKHGKNDISQPVGPRAISYVRYGDKLSAWIYHDDRGNPYNAELSTAQGIWDSVTSGASSALDEIKKRGSGLDGYFKDVGKPAGQTEQKGGVSAYDRMRGKSSPKPGSDGSGSGKKEEKKEEKGQPSELSGFEPTPRYLEIDDYNSVIEYAAKTFDDPESLKKYYREGKISVVGFGEGTTDAIYRTRTGRAYLVYDDKESLGYVDIQGGRPVGKFNSNAGVSDYARKLFNRHSGGVLDFADQATQGFQRLKPW